MTLYGIKIQRNQILFSILDTQMNFYSVVLCRNLRKLRMKIYQKKFLPRWSFVKLIPYINRSRISAITTATLALK
jgi:hypothetical protein